jgi:biopolymer transport protein ExbD
MDGAFGGSPRKRLPGINITPLVDVMLLLIIFFAISSSFEEKSGLDVSLPKSTEASAQEPVDRVITVGEDGQFQYGDQMGLDEQALEAAVRESLAGNPDAVVVLRADEASTYQKYIQALDVAKRCGVKKLVLQTKSVPAP